MHAGITVTLACLFVFLAGFNVWNRLASGTTSARNHQLWIQIHRMVGYAFTALFAILCYFMLLRIKGLPDELPPRLILHMGLALMLAPLLLVKVIVARFQKAAIGLLQALGVAVFALAFTLVAVNLATDYLRAASPQTVSSRVSATVVIVLLGAAITAFFSRGRTRPIQAGPAAGLDSPKPAPQLSNHAGQVLTLTLARIYPQTPDAKTFRFLLPPGQQITPRPGQFLTFEWIINGKPLTRSYSICSSPAQSGFVEVTVKRAANGCVSQFLNDHARVGLTVKARGPYGHFCFDETKHKRVVLIAAGSGITPMMAILRYMDDRCIPASATCIYCVRTEPDIFFRKEFAELQNRLDRLRLVFVLSQPSSPGSFWAGRLRREILEAEVQNISASTFFVCGPPSFMNLAFALLKELGVERSRILQESFGNAVAPTAPAAADAPLEMKFSRSKAAFRIVADRTLLESAEKNGVLIPFGCRQGICGTCATRLLDGQVQAPDAPALTDEQRSEGFILPCVSRPLSHVTLDA